VRERSFRIASRDLPLVLLAALLIFVNQLGFVYGVDDSNASTVALILGTTPIFIGIIATLAHVERVRRSFWAAAALSFAGVGFVAWGSGGFAGHVRGDLFALLTASTWAAYSVTIAPLMARYSPFRISALVLAIGWIPLAVAGATQTAHQSFHFGSATWIGFAYAVVGPLFMTNILWFTAIGRVGPARASLFANLQPFFAVVFALVILGERLDGYELVGAAAIFGGIALERAWRRRPALSAAD
jgi:drug/metabolite transporter (DMT)-like permease